MEVYFLDVGLGSCQVILLGGARAIVIDCGVKNDHLALQMLKRLGVNDIECLITSHNDNDHTGGAISILGDYRDRIAHIFVVQDHKLMKSKYWRRIEYLIKSNTLAASKVKRLELEDQPKLLWSSGDGTDIKLFSPSFPENMLAQGAGASNATSAVIVLDHHGSRVIFAADSVISQWREIHRRRNGRKLECDILAVPHHGGCVDDEAGDLDWLYDNAVNARYAVVSAGTRANPKHPREEVVTKLSVCGSNVLCTEITSKCHSNPASLAPGLIRKMKHFGRARDAVGVRGVRPVACMGTVLALLDNGAVEIDGAHQHKDAVDNLERSAGGCPMCRLAAS